MLEKNLLLKKVNRSNKGLKHGSKTMLNQSYHIVFQEKTFRNLAISLELLRIFQNGLKCK